MAERGRPKGANGEESRALLLEVAANEFAKNGYHKTKVSSIVKRASLSQPAFYLYFKNKEAIFEELEDLFRWRMMEFVKKSRLEPELQLSTLKERIAYGLRNLLEYLAENPGLTQIGFYISPRANEVKKQLVEQIEENLKFEVNIGYFRKGVDTQMVAESLIGIIERVTFSQLLSKQKEPAQVANNIVDLLFEGILDN